MKTLKILAAAALSSIALTGAASAQVCNQTYEVVKHHINGQSIFEVIMSYQTPGMARMQATAPQRLLEAEVAPFAANGAKRLCYIANDPLRLNDPCETTEYVIEGALFGFGTEICNDRE